MRQKKVVFSNQKGGVGKTTLTRELGIYLAAEGRTVLVIDLDPQANLTRSLTDEEHPGCHEALSCERFEIAEIQPNLSLLAGDIKMAMLEKSLIAEIDAYTRMKELFEHKSFRPFEYILIDSPPSLGVLTVNALTAAEYLIIPMNPSLYSMQGTNDLMSTVQKVKRSLNSDLKLLGVIINAFDSIPVITRQIKEEIENSFRDKVFSSVLSKSIKIEEAIARQKGIITLEKGKVKDEIIRIGEELLDRLHNTPELKQEA
ncbi:MAG: ParA family protein [Deltaproteobacteria bacterium]|nr:ParA family protein [Deltaproteobacteria bacterium]